MRAEVEEETSIAPSIRSSQDKDAKESSGEDSEVLEESINSSKGKITSPEAPTPLSALESSQAPAGGDAESPESKQSPRVDARSSSNSSTSTGGGEVQEKTVAKSGRGTFVPKDVDVNWVPKEAEIVWTRFDKSRTQALAIIVRCPSNKEAEVYDTSVPSVYCDTDGPDRYLVAFISNEAHVYPPRHYLVKFNFETAPKHKCMKAKVSSLTPWDKSKRKAVKDALAYAKGVHKFENSHNFRMCCTCCEEGSEKFWTAIGLDRGTIHIDAKPQLEKQKARAKKAQERKERMAERKLKEKEKRRPQTRAATRESTKTSTKRKYDSEEESETDVTSTSDSDTQSSTGVSRGGSDVESGAAASDEGMVAVSDSEDDSEDDEDNSGDDFSLQGAKNTEGSDDDVNEASLRRRRPQKKKKAPPSGAKLTTRQVTPRRHKRVKSAVSETEICARRDDTERPLKKRKERGSPSSEDKSPTEEKNQPLRPG